MESGNDNARSDDDDDDSNVGCGDKLNSASRVDKIFISPDGVEFRSLVAAKGSIGLDAKVAKVETANAYGLPAMAAAKADVPGARRTGHKKRTRGNTFSIAGEEEEERIRHNTKLLRVLARKELVDGDDSDDYGDLYMGPC